MDVIIPATNISFAQMFTMIFSGTFGLLGLIFVIIGLIFNSSLSKKRNLCTAYTEGTVSAMQTQFGTNGLRAVYSFTIDGKPMQYVSSYAGSNDLLVGQSVGIYYDPQNIGRVYIEEDARQLRIIPRVFTILGCVFVAVALIVAVFLMGIL